MAEEQVGRQDVQGFELAPYIAENPLQIFQHPGGELVHQEGAAGLERFAGFEQDALAHRRGNGAEGNAGNDIAGVALSVLPQDLVKLLDQIDKAEAVQNGAKNPGDPQAKNGTNQASTLHQLESSHCPANQIRIWCPR